MHGCMRLRACDTSLELWSNKVIKSELFKFACKIRTLIHDSREGLV